MGRCLSFRKGRWLGICCLFHMHQLGSFRFHLRARFLGPRILLVLSPGGIWLRRTSRMSGALETSWDYGGARQRFGSLSPLQPKLFWSYPTRKASASFFPLTSCYLW